MNTPERDFYNYIRPHIPGHVQRVENSAGSGMPDVNVGYEGGEVWVELKATELNRVLLRKEQYAWSMRRYRAAGSRIYVVTGFEDMVGVWQFPHVAVIPYGKAEKYVRIINDPAAKFHKSLVSNHLINLLFPVIKPRDILET